MSTGRRPNAAAPAPEARLGGGLTGRMLLASALLLLILGAAFTMLLVAVADLRESVRAARNSEEVLATANELERLVIDLETGVRGFVITREEQFLEPWHTARRSLPAHAATLERLSAGDPEQARTARQITQAAGSYVEQYATPLISAARRGDPAARGVTVTAEGKRRVDAMRVDFGTFIGTERRLADAREAQADDAARRAVLAVVGGLVASVLLVLLFTGYLTRAIVQPVRRAARMAVRLAGGDLSTRMPAISVAEVGQLERSFNQMAGSLERNRDELAELAAEQAALRRVATLVARGAAPNEVFSAVAEEVAQRLGAEVAKVLRYEPDGTATVVGGWSVPGMDIPIGTRLTVEGEGAAVSVLRTGRPARAERLEGPDGSVAACFRSLGVHTTVGSPILVEGRLWGVTMAGWTKPDPPPVGSEDRILAFTELVASAIANAEARAGLRRIAEEQAALRRVATLVARGVAPDLVLAAVAEETRELLSADLTTIFRFEPDGTATLMGGHGWRQADMDLGTRWKPKPPSVVASVLETGRPARSDDYSPTSQSLPEVVRREGIRSGVASPILVEGRLWGAIVVSSRHGPLPPDTEQRMVDFTELVATAIANAESRAELTASRARVVAAADQTRRRLERDLHDGAQQRLVSLALRLRTAAMAIPPEMREVHEELAGVGSELDEVLGDLRELSRGIHPAILSEGGLGPALRTLARRASVPVQLQVGTPERLPERVEVAAYYVVSEALTNVAKHANASAVQVDVDADDGVVRLAIRDDGVGGADPTRGSGLIGLKDRVEATGGTLHVESRPGEGTSLVVELPIDAGQPRNAT